MLTEEQEKRFILICKPEQSGKTFVMIQVIIKDIQYPPESNVDVINIIFCDNNLLLTKQTSNRINKEISSINNESYLEFSSHSRTDYKCVDNVCNGIIFKEIHNVICCTNGSRIADIHQLITTINNGKLTKGKYIFKIWLDEADKYIKFILDYIDLLKEFENVYLYCISATPKNIFYRFNSINVFPIENTTSENYHGWCDNQLKIIDLNTNSSDFIIHVLDSFTLGADKIIPGTIWFIPGEFKKVSHYEISNICNERNFAVLIINGDGITLKFPDKRIETYFKDDELNTILKKIYKEQSLEKFPVAITGNVCIGRGTSMMSEDFIIDYAILSICDNKQEASQNAGRVKGNIKHWSNYKPPIVFTSPKFDAIAREWEIKSRNIAKIAFDKQEEGKSTLITKEEFKNIGNEFQNKETNLNLRVPYYFNNIDKKNIIFKNKTRKINKYKELIKIISCKDLDLNKFIKYVYENNPNCAKFTRPEDISTRKTCIDSTLNKYNNNTPFIVAYGDKDKNKDGFVCIIDYINYSVFICVNVINKEFNL
jgi:hypothetical protein